MLSIFALRAFFWKHERVLNMLFNIGQLHHELLFFSFFCGDSRSPAADIILCCVFLYGDSFLERRLILTGILPEQLCRSAIVPILDHQ